MESCGLHLNPLSVTLALAAPVRTCLLLSLRDRDSAITSAVRWRPTAARWLEGNLDIMLEDQIPALATYTSHIDKLTAADHEATLCPRLSSPNSAGKGEDTENKSMATRSQGPGDSL